MLLGGLPNGVDSQKLSIPVLLQAIQEQSAYLTQLDMDVGRSKEFISRAIKMGGAGSGVYILIVFFSLKLTVVPICL